MSSVMLGMVAMRAPAFAASIFARVWVMEVLMGHKTTSAAFMAAAMGAGGSWPDTSRGVIVTSMASAPRALAAWYRASPMGNFPSSVITRTFSPAFTFIQEVRTPFPISTKSTVFPPYDSSSITTRAARVLDRTTGFPETAWKRSFISTVYPMQSITTRSTSSSAAWRAACSSSSGGP